MAEYIEREAANDALRECVRAYPNSFYSGIEVARSAIIKLPAADVRPVVLCRDCRDSYEWANVDGDKYRYCGYLRSRWNCDTDRMVNDDDFCKWGRKREEK